MPKLKAKVKHYKIGVRLNNYPTSKMILDMLNVLVKYKGQLSYIEVSDEKK